MEGKKHILAYNTQYNNDKHIYTSITTMFKEEQIITESTTTQQYYNGNTRTISKLKSIIDVAYCPVCGRKLHK